MPWWATSLLCFVLISQTFKVVVLTVSSQCMVGLCAALKTENIMKKKVAKRVKIKQYII